DLITDGKVVLLGAIRQEVLSGVRHPEQFSRLRDYLRTFPDLERTTAACEGCSYIERKLSLYQND
ncbi:MAG: hypothetical protein ACRCU2_00520, partial [Planktothrix sp.]